MNKSGKYVCSQVVPAEGGSTESAETKQSAVSAEGLDSGITGSSST